MRFVFTGSKEKPVGGIVRWESDKLLVDAPISQLAEGLICNQDVGWVQVPLGAPSLATHEISSRNISQSRVGLNCLNKEQLSGCHYSVATVSWQRGVVCMTPHESVHDVDWNNLCLVIALQKPVRSATIVGSTEPTSLQLWH